MIEQLLKPKDIYKVIDNLRIAYELGRIENLDEALDKIEEKIVELETVTYDDRIFKYKDNDKLLSISPQYYAGYGLGIYNQYTKKEERITIHYTTMKHLRDYLNIIINDYETGKKSKGEVE